MTTKHHHLTGDNQNADKRFFPTVRNYAFKENWKSTQ